MWWSGAGAAPSAREVGLLDAHGPGRDLAEKPAGDARGATAACPAGAVPLGAVAAGAGVDEPAAPHRQGRDGDHGDQGE